VLQNWTDVQIQNMSDNDDDDDIAMLTCARKLADKRQRKGPHGETDAHMDKSSIT